MPLYMCQPPTGYTDTADAWVNTGALVSRMNFALQLVRRTDARRPWTRPRPQSAIRDDASSPSDVSRDDARDDRQGDRRADRCSR